VSAVGEAVEQDEDDREHARRLNADTQTAAAYSGHRRSRDSGATDP
jgi:hypothetical protein